MVGFNESQKVAAISKVFADSYKSPESVIVVDNVERLLGTSYIRHVRIVSLNFDQIGHRLDLGSPMPCCRHYWYSLHGDRQRSIIRSQCNVI
jgi:hypothetical protein